MALKVSIMVGALAIAACAPAPDPGPETPEIEWEGEWLRFGRSPDVEPQCAGVAPYMDRYVGALIDIFEIRADVTVDFYYVDDVSTPCESLGCVRGHSAFSLVPLQEHELVHAVRSLEELSHHVLEEGAAELWGDDSRVYSFRTDTDGDLLAAVEAVTPYEEGLPSQSYGLAGRFHALMMSEAPDAANVLLRSTSRTTSAQELDAVMEAETGRDLAAWAQRLDEYPVCEHAVYRDASAACVAARPVELCESGDVVDIVEWIGCEDEETLGPRDGEVWKYLSIELIEPGPHSLYIAPDFEMKGGSIRIERCEGGCGSMVEDFPVPSVFTPARALDVSPGRYLLRLSLPEGTSGEFSLQIAGECG